MKTAIFWPMIAQAGLSALVWLLMYLQRLREIHSRRIDLQSLATNRSLSAILENTGAADNFRNLFETPVLFFAVCLCLAVTDTVDQLQLVLAWMYVALRFVHSYIHATHNRVAQRFAAYVLSTFCLFAMWAFFAASLANR